METGDILHYGTVVGQNGNKLKVRIQVEGACEHCRVKGGCAAAGNKDRLLEVPLPDSGPSFETGETVRIRMHPHSGMKAVLYAYVLPVLLLMGVVISLYACAAAEEAVALAALGVLTLYYAGLYLYRRRIDRKFSLSVEKSGQ